MGTHLPWWEGAAWLPVKPPVQFLPKLGQCWEGLGKAGMGAKHEAW